jgi:hypothetical protein
MPAAFAISREVQPEKPLAMKTCFAASLILSSVVESAFTSFSIWVQS